MTNVEIPKILEQHKLWLATRDKGEKADLHGADLTGAVLRETTLPDGRTLTDLLKEYTHEST